MKGERQTCGFPFQRTISPVGLEMRLLEGGVGDPCLGTSQLSLACYDSWHVSPTRGSRVTLSPFFYTPSINWLVGLEAGTQE